MKILPLLNAWLLLVSPCVILARPGDTVKQLAGRFGGEGRVLNTKKLTAVRSESVMQWTIASNGGQITVTCWTLAGICEREIYTKAGGFTSDEKFQVVSKLGFLSIPRANGKNDSIILGSTAESIIFHTNLWQKSLLPKEKTESEKLAEKLAEKL